MEWSAWNAVEHEAAEARRRQHLLEAEAVRDLNHMKRK